MARVDQIPLLLERSDGTISIMSFVTRQYDSGDGPGWVRQATTENIEAEIAKMMTLYPDESILRWRFMDKAEPRPLRDFRGAWRFGTDLIGVDMPAARDIHRENLRGLRAPKLAALDVMYLRALETDDADQGATIATLKQELRDATADPRIEAAQTPEELKAVIPDALKG